jgi:hypothetical protein
MWFLIGHKRIKGKGKGQHTPVKSDVTWCSVLGRARDLLAGHRISAYFPADTDIVYPTLPRRCVPVS